MASLRDIQRKIGAVKKTKQITKAMNMVASAKLRNAQLRIERFRPYADKYYEIIADLSSRADASVHPLLERREAVKNVGIILVTSDKGLCGSFNTNLCVKAEKLASQKQAEGKTVKFICIGKKGRDYIRKRGFEIIDAKADIMNNFDFQLANDIGNEIIDKYIAADLDEVQIVYGQFVTVIRQEAKVAQILPVESTTETVQEGPSSEYIFEPSVEGLLAELLPRYIKVQVYRGLLDTSASEHAARMTAMDNATKNCDELVHDLTLAYNKARQATITAELMDIVGGAEALKQG
ncbi:F0F1 ATP synthase subunit gamma [Desulfohalobiaceae bacterium Ax17]|jgi:F-type H+-transporting ATPase subunit gamma|uniref:F0F1 ATP synthase subunit gamma n=1 Tax=Desulfovulcanus ferrireducens TaxID=2831190 RepID=UPI00207BB468|nr:F0F1 ATP synthase subunit gamma [Desulfovulcanus ferrireducens]MBT8763285.1 F0F1 ATP synthase subunit gamma [Desulfovulcanus ferrireducens]